MKRHISLTLLVMCLFVVLSGCASKKGTGGSWVGALPEETAIQSIADDAVSQLASQYAPGHTTIMLETPKEKTDVFSNVFENRLRTAGFTISQVNSLDTVKVAYVLDRVNPIEKEGDYFWYLQLRLQDQNGENQYYARSYTPYGASEAGRSYTASNDLSFLAKAKAKVRKVTAEYTTRFDDSSWSGKND